MSKNRLSESVSPYLLQHADNPVDWQPWDKAAFDEAKARNVPIHLSIGYAACHWCHVMAHESFENADIAAQLNRGFVNIKVDREERPDVDKIYMQALQGLGEQGGWPLTMFLTPEGRPFWGGTYFPPAPRWGRPGFPQVLAAMTKAWESGDEAVSKNSAALFDMLDEHRPAGPAQGAGSQSDLINRAADQILTVWDMEEGGFNSAPKFPQAPVLEALWRNALRTNGDTPRRAVLATLDGLSFGGIYDHVGGGFSRYSVDSHWLVPHFEKMLSDNGQLLGLLALANQQQPNPVYRQKIEETVAWLEREMRLKDGGFAASLDADTEGEEGLTYVWTPAEVRAVLSDEDATLFCQHYDITEGGNFEGKSIPNRLARANRQWLGDELEKKFAALRHQLLDARNDRPQPHQDSKILADWNGTAIAGLVQASISLDRPDWLELAKISFDNIRMFLTVDNRMAHAFADGRVTAPGFATDYAQMIKSALALYHATAESDYITLAESWTDAAANLFWDDASASYRLVAYDTDDLIVRPNSIQDEALPSATGLMAQNLAALHMITGRTRDGEMLETILTGNGQGIEKDIVSTGSLQSGIDTLIRGRSVIQAGHGPSEANLRARVLSEADPALFYLEMSGTDDLPGNHPALDKIQEGSDTRVYVCQGMLCHAPVSTERELSDILLETRTSST